MTMKQEKLIENYVRQKVKKMLKEESSENVTDLLLQMLKAFDSGASQIKSSRENQNITNKLVNIRAELYKLYLQSDKSA
jgi:hypothetical protein